MTSFQRSGRRLAVRRAATLWLLVVLSSAAACFSEDPGTGPGNGNGADAVVDMTDDLRFVPVEVEVRVGERVLWRNVSNVPHTVTADTARVFDPENVVLPDGAVPFHSGAIAPGGEYDVTFDTPGEYQYVCVPHESAAMFGRVRVVP